MGLKEIELEIRKSGEEEIKKIEQETKKTIDEINKKIKEEAEIVYKQTKLRREKELSIIIKKIISDAQVLKRKKLNSKKAEILEKVFEKAREKILNLSDEEKRKVLENLSKEKGGLSNYTIYVSKKYSYLLEDAKVDEKVDDFGVIIESKDGSLRIDNTLTNFINRMRIKLEPEIVKILFSKS